MTARAIASLAVVCVLAFWAGRSVPRDGASGASFGAADDIPAARRALPVGGAASEATALRARVPTLPATGPTALGLRVFPEWAEAVDADPDAADAVHQSVLEILEARRRRVDAAIRSCFDSSAPVGLVAVRFAVSVRSIARRLRVGNPQFVEVEEGVPLSSATARCLERHLGGDDVVEANGTRHFLPAFVGRASYTARFYFPATPSGDAG